LEAYQDRSGIKNLKSDADPFGGRSVASLRIQFKYSRTNFCGIVLRAFTV